MQRVSEFLYRKMNCDIDIVNLPIRAEQIRTRLRGYPLMIVTQMIIALLLCGLMWGKVAHGVLLGWLVALYAAHLLEGWYWWRYRQATRTLAECCQWRTRFIVFVTLVGVAWGSAGMLMFVAGDLAYQAMLACVVLGLAAGATTINPVFPPALYIYVTLLIVPLTLENMLLADSTHLTLAGMLSVYLAFVLNSGGDMAKTFELSLRREWENTRLVEQMTEEKLRAERAQHSAEQANQMKSKFFAAASHDLRQPMHALALFVEVLKGREHDEQTVRLIGQVENSVEALAGMFDALLDISKLDAGVVQPHCEDVRIQALLDRMYAEFSWLAHDKGLSFEVGNCLHAVYTDPLLLERVLRNLISNAVRYTDQGGVTVTCETVDEGVQLVVRDTGIGIAPEHFPHIFEEYYQVGNKQRDRSKGLGLGLAIVKRLEQLLGYRMKLESTLGKGSCFTLLVPFGRRISRGPSNGVRDAMINPAQPT